MQVISFKISRLGVRSGECRLGIGNWVYGIISLFYGG